MVKNRTKRSDQAIALRRRSARMRRIDRLHSVAEMVQNPLNHCGFLDAGNDAQAAAALLAGLDVNGEHPLEALCPAHRPLPIGGRCLATLSDSACPGHNLCPVRARRCEHAMVPGQVRAGFWHQRGEAGNKVLGLKDHVRGARDFSNNNIISRNEFDNSDYPFGQNHAIVEWYCNTGLQKSCVDAGHFEDYS